MEDCCSDNKSKCW